MPVTKHINGTALYFYKNNVIQRDSGSLPGSRVSHTKKPEEVKLNRSQRRKIEKKLKRR